MFCSLSVFDKWVLGVNRSWDPLPTPNYLCDLMSGDGGGKTRQPGMMRSEQKVEANKPARPAYGFVLRSSYKACSAVQAPPCYDPLFVTASSAFF